AATGRCSIHGRRKYTDVAATAMIATSIKLTARRARGDMASSHLAAFSLTSAHTSSALRGQSRPPPGGWTLSLCRWRGCVLQQHVAGAKLTRREQPKGDPALRACRQRAARADQDRVDHDPQLVEQAGFHQARREDRAPHHEHLLARLLLERDQVL